MSKYDRKVAQLEAHARFLNGQMAQLVAEGEKLISLKSALLIAFSERCHREFDDRTDEFSAEDERRAEELLELLPESGS